MPLQVTCDTISDLYKHGKRTASAILLKHLDTLMGLAKFHRESKDAGLDAARILLILRYEKGIKGKNWETLDTLRFKMAASTDKPMSCFPPTDDAFMQHALRAKLEIIIWCTSHIAKPKTLDPIDHGWIKCSGNLEYVTFAKESVPREPNGLTHFDCNDEKCSCILTCLKFLEICICDKCC